MDTNDTMTNSTIVYTEDNSTTLGDTSEDDEVPLAMTITKYAVPVTFALIIIIGLAGNGTLTFIVLKIKNMRTTPNIFIVSLALGDILLLVTSVPFYMIIYIIDHWSFGNFFCKLNGFLVSLSVGVSVFTLTALSGDRFMAIMYPMNRHLESPIPRTPLIASGLWLLSMALAMFEGTIHHVKVENSSNLTICTAHPESFGVWFPCFRAVFRFMVYCLIPVLIIGVLYSIMAYNLWQSQGPVLPAQRAPLTSPNVSSAVTKQAEARKKIAKLVLAIVFLFILCWLPRHIYTLWYHCMEGDYNMFWYVLKVTSFCLSFLNSCINPFALYILSDQFRRYYNRYLFCGWCRDRGGVKGTGAHGWNVTKARNNYGASTDARESSTTQSYM